MADRLFIVTGAFGHLGNTLVRKLLEQGEHVRGLALPGEQVVPFGSPEPEIIRGDVRDKKSLAPLFASPEGTDVYVIHTAGIVTISSKFVQKVYDVNVTGTKNILEMCRLYHVKRLVHVSSVHAIPEQGYGKVMTEIDHFSAEDVHGLYAKTKAEATQAVLDAAREGLDACVVHPSGIIGPGDYGHGHLTQMIMDYMDGRLTACVKGGYDFVDVRDVADGILAAARKGQKGGCYILSNRYMAVPELLSVLHDVTGKRAIRTVLPFWFARCTAPLSEIYYKIRRQPPLYTAYSMDVLHGNGSFSHDKATRELGYCPRPLEETLRDTAEWLYQNHRLKKTLPTMEKKASRATG